MTDEKQPTRSGYPSDITDEEWALVAHLVPEAEWIPNLQEPRHCARNMLNARLSPDLRFEMLGVFVGIRSRAIHFRNQKGRLSVETFEIGDSGRVTRAAAHHA